MPTLNKLAKAGDYEGVKAAVDAADIEQLKTVFAVAATDFRTVRRQASHQRILCYCIDQGLPPDLPLGWMGLPAICWAAMFGNRQIVEYFGLGAVEDPFIAACLGELDFWGGYRGDAAAALHPNGFNLLHFTALCGLGKEDADFAARQAQSGRLLLDRGVDPKASVHNGMDLSPAFLCAWYGGNLVLMEALIDNGGLPAESFPATLEFALEPHQRRGAMHVEIASLLLDRGYDINRSRADQNGRTVLHGCANRGAVGPVEWLLRHGADVGAVDGGGDTPLHAACRRNTSTGVMRLLVDGGADLAARNRQGETPLDLALESKRQKVVDFLLTALS